MNNKLLNPNSPLKLETALFLSPNQAEALNHFNFIVTGFYGAGKTTALECAIDKIIEKPTEFPNPKIILCTWDESQELQRKFKEKMEKIKSKNHPHLKEDSLQVVSLKDVCDQYQVKPMQSWQWSWLLSLFWLDRSKVDVLNDLCRKIKGKCVIFISTNDSFKSKNNIFSLLCWKLCKRRSIYSAVWMDGSIAFVVWCYKRQ